MNLFDICFFFFKQHRFHTDPLKNFTNFNLEHEWSRLFIYRSSLKIIINPEINKCKIEEE